MREDFGGFEDEDEDFSAVVRSSNWANKSSAVARAVERDDDMLIW